MLAFMIFIAVVATTLAVLPLVLALRAESRLERVPVPVPVSGHRR